MTPEAWRRVRDLFDEVLEQPTTQRGSYLDQACGSDTYLRRELEALLAADAGAAGFIERPAWPREALGGDADPKDSLVGERLGPYELVALVGRGGMGAVYRAVRADDEYRKQVAIKVIRRGLDDAVVLQRFRNERQILATLDHPNIARLLDGGSSADGRPYVVMDYVEGRPIDEYCRERALSVAARLELFEQVCAAVSYAHRHLVVHRDLKPGNILVTSDGVPKLLDFGIAKLLDPVGRGESTAAGLGPLTPDYASPEQVRGERITTASDVYSLGVLLFELLTGRKPYALLTGRPEELLRVVCLDEPPRPSRALTQTMPGATSRPAPTAALRRALRGDLDNIVLMALRKEPQRRYASVEQLAEDLRRHVEGRPVRARADTLSYRASKFVRRNRLAVAAAALALAALVAGALATLYQARRAERRFGDVRRLANAFLFDFHDAVADLPGSLQARELVVTKGLEYLDSLAREAGDDPDLARELAVAYTRVGDVQGGPYGGASVGNAKGALKSYATALQLLDRLLAQRPGDQAAALARAALFNRLADVTRGLKDLEGSRKQLDRARTESQRLLAVAPNLPGAHLELARSLDGFSIVALRGGEVDEALASAQAGLLELAPLDEKTPAAPELDDVRGALQRDLARAFVRKGDFAAAILAYRRACEAWERLIAARPARRSYRRHLAIALDYLSETLKRDGRGAEALHCVERAVPLLRALSEADPTDSGARRDLMLALANRGMLLVDQSRGADAVASGKEALEIAEAQHAAEPDSSGVRRGLLYAKGLLAEVLGKLGRDREAVPLLEQVLEISKRLASDDPSNNRALEDVAKAHMYLGISLGKSGRLGEALENHERTLRVYEQMAARAPEDRETRMLVGEALAHLGDDHLRLAFAPGAGERVAGCQAAQAAFRRSLEVYEALKREGALEGSMLPEVERVRRASTRCAPPEVAARD